MNRFSLDGFFFEVVNRFGFVLTTNKNFIQSMCIHNKAETAVLMFLFAMMTQYTDWKKYRHINRYTWSSSTLSLFNAINVAVGWKSPINQYANVWLTHADSRWFLVIFLCYLFEYVYIWIVCWPLLLHSCALYLLLEFWWLNRFVLVPKCKLYLFLFRFIFFSRYCWICYYYYLFLFLLCRVFIFRADDFTLG